ncbi:MAG: hypothetical protein ACREHV_00250 [Rhizomicrobium sp.]
MASTYATERTILRAETTGSIVEVVGGIAIIVLSIIALARIGNVGALPAISTIILGAALIAEGGTIATEFSRLMTGVLGGTASVGEFSGGMTTEIVVGAVVLVLGVLGILGVSPATLLPSAVIVAGGLLLIAATNVQRMNALKAATLAANETGQALLQTAISGAAGFQVLAAIAAIVLGIIALSSAANVALFTVVGLLVLGAAVTMSGGTLTGSLTRLLNR